MNKSTRNTLIGAGIASSAIAAFGAVSHTVTKKLISVGMDRQAPAKFAEARPKFNRSPALQGAMVQLEQAGDSAEPSHRNCRNHFRRWDPSCGTPLPL